MLRLLVTCALLAGCSETSTTTVSGVVPTAGPAAPLVNPTFIVAGQADIGSICASIAQTRGTTTAQAGIAQLHQITAFTKRELADIANGQVANGMTEKAALCALGGSSIAVKNIQTVSSMKHLVKSYSFSNSSATLTTDNGIVIQFRQ